MGSVKGTLLQLFAKNKLGRLEALRACTQLMMLRNTFTALGAVLPRAWCPAGLPCCSCLQLTAGLVSPRHLCVWGKQAGQQAAPGAALRGPAAPCCSLQCSSRRVVVLSSVLWDAVPGGAPPPFPGCEHHFAAGNRERAPEVTLTDFRITIRWSSGVILC